MGGVIHTWADGLGLHRKANRQATGSKLVPFPHGPTSAPDGVPALVSTPMDRDMEV